MLRLFTIDGNCFYVCVEVGDIELQLTKFKSYKKAREFCSVFLSIFQDFAFEESL